MNNPKGFSVLAAMILVCAIVLGGIGYVVMSSQSSSSATPQENTNDGLSTYAEPVITWKFTEEAEKDGMPQTNVAVIFNGKSHTIGTFTGSCSEIGALGGIDGKGLLAGELSAAQCWFAGGGNEIGVFAIEDGGYEVMVGGLGEGEEGSPMFRGDFIIREDIKL